MGSLGDLGGMLSLLLDGFAVTVAVFVLTLVFSIPLGFLVAKGRMSKIKVVSGLVRFYISIMRGTPLMLQLLLVYFGPYYLFKIPLRNLNIETLSGTLDYRYVATIIGFSLNYAAYFAEIFRGGIQSMPIGQYEAAQILGFSKTQTFFRIILPQVIKRVLPACTNEIITLVKDTSLAQVIAVGEMFFVAKGLSSTMVSIMPLAAAGVFYYVFNWVIERLMNAAEKKLNYYQ